MKSTKDKMQKGFRLTNTINKINPNQRTKVTLLLITAVILLIEVVTAGNNRLHNRNFDSKWTTGIPNVDCIAHDVKFTCDCQKNAEVMQLPHLIGYVFQIEIKNCTTLTINANTLDETQGLRKITFQNIDNLILNEYALAFPRYASNTPLIITFENVNFEKIDSHAINGNIEEISFIHGRIDMIHPFGFTTLKDHAILLKMENILIRNIEPQAFKKFAVDQIEITDCEFESNVPSKAFYELEVLISLRITNVKFNQVHSHAFSFRTTSKLIITDNTFMATDSEWIETHVKENVVIRSNQFGNTSRIAFRGISMSQDYTSSEKLDLHFDNNTIRFFNKPQPLEFNKAFSVHINKLQIENLFDCHNVDFTQSPAALKETFYAKNLNQIYFYRVESSKPAEEQIQSFFVLSKIIELDCQQHSYTYYILFGVLILIVILILITIIVCTYFYKKRKKRKMDVVMPEPRTYKETQIVYQIENAGLLKTDF